MSEEQVIQRSPEPQTRQSLADDLRRLGVTAGMTLLVHSSLSALGWVCGGPVAVIQALLDVLTPAGTLVMPAHSGENSDPANWSNPSVPPAWHSIIREQMPAFDPRLTPTREMGRIAELFRTWPDVHRSGHPQTSFAAWGRHARTITADHRLESALGEHSPLARIYDLDGYILLLGVGHANNTSFHLAEYRSGVAVPCQSGAAVWQDGRRCWQTFTNVDFDSDDFADLGRDLEQAHAVQIGRVGQATCRLLSQRTAVDFAQVWLPQHRSLA